MRETGLTEKALGKRSMSLVFWLSFVLSVVAAAVFALFLGPEVDLGFGFGAGLSAGLCWVAASFAINDLFEGKSFRLLAINGGGPHRPLHALRGDSGRLVTTAYVA